MKKLSLGLSLAGLLALESEAQINQNQAFSVDSLIANTYLTSPVVHSENINETYNGPVLTWDAVNGRFGNESVAYSHVGKVDEEKANAINEVSGQNYTLFNLDHFSDVNQYQQAVENWLKNLGLPVSVNNLSPLEKKVFPNPTRGNLNLESNIPAGQDYKIRIYDMAGRLIQEYKGMTKNNGLNVGLDLSEYSNGMYIINFENKKTTFSTRVIKQ